MAAIEAEMVELRQDIKDLKRKIDRMEALPQGESDRDLLRLKYHCLAELQKQKTFMMQQQAAAGAQAGGSLPVYASQDLCWALVETGPAEPPPLLELYGFMTTLPEAKVPITRMAMQQISSPELAAHFCVAEGPLAQAVGSSISCRATPGSEIRTAILENTCLVEILLAMDAALAFNHRIGLHEDRDNADSTSLMTLASPSGQRLRPDGVIRTVDGFRLLATWEDKAAGHTIQDAVKDLRDKTAAWTPLYYGDAQYLPCFAAAGDQLQFFAIPRTSPHQPVAITPILSMGSPVQRAELALCCVKFYQLLRAQNNVYPSNVLPAAKDLVKFTTISEEKKITRTLYFRTDRIEVQKRIKPWTLYAGLTGVEFEDLAALYQATALAQGLVHAVSGPRLDTDKDAYAVEIQPVGLQHTAATPQDEEDLRRCAHGVLHALAAMHAAQFVHRDLRWPNVAASYNKQRWFLLDLEMSMRVGRTCKPEQMPASWGDAALVERSYVAASDLYELGRMLQERIQHVDTPLGREFLSLLDRPAHALQTGLVTAASLLQHAWLRCPGAHCREAGAQPGESGS